MAITWLIEIDELDDWTYGEDITSRVFAFDARQGYDQPGLHEMAIPRAEFRCYNGDNFFTPGAAAQGSAIVGRFIRIRNNDGLTTRVKWAGVIREMIVDAISLTATLKCSGRLDSVKGTVPFEVMRNVTAGEIIKAVLDRVDMPRKLVSSNGPYWILGRGELGTSTVLASAEVENIDLGIGSDQDGDSTFELVGNHYTQPMADVIVNDACRAEWGWLLETQSIFFLYRSFSMALSPGTTLVATEHAFSSGPVINRASVVLAPTYITEDDTLWTLQTPMRFSKKRNLRRIHFRDTDGRALALDGDLTEPVDWTVYRAETGSVPVTRARVSVRPDASGAYIEVRLPKNRTEGWLYAGVNLVGDAIHQDQPVTIVAQDNYSVIRHGVATLETRLPNYASIDHAEDLAQFVVAVFPLDGGRVAWVDVVDNAVQNVLSVFDGTQIEIPGLDLEQRTYVIIGLWHRYDRGVWITRAYLEWQGTDHFWLLGRNRLNQDTYLGF